MTGRFFSMSLWLTGFVLALAGLGCGAGGEMRLLQPQLQGWQRELKLESDQARWAVAADSEVERVLAEFPLPGARTGRPAYLLYLRLPSSESEVRFGDAGPSEAEGFVIQSRGEYAGLSRIKEGTVRVSGAASTPGAKRELEIDLICDDGSQLIGQVNAVRDDYAVSRFEKKRRPADVKALDNPASQPAGRTGS